MDQARREHAAFLKSKVVTKRRDMHIGELTVLIRYLSHHQALNEVLSATSSRQSYFQRILTYQMDRMPLMEMNRWIDICECYAWMGKYSKLLKLI